MKATMLDDRKGWQERIKTTIDTDDLSEQWSEVKEYINNMKDISITILMDVGGHGKLTINSEFGNQIRNLFVWNDKVKLV